MEPSTTASDPATPSDAPSTTASTSTPPSPSMEATSSQTARPKAGPLRRRLLTAAEVPGFNDQFGWKPGGTRPGEPAGLFGTCQRFDLSSIGATRTVTRGYRPEPAESRDVAGELVAEFPDDATARRAFEVLKSWRAKCADRLRGKDRPKVGGLQEVTVTGGTGAWYLLTYKPVQGDPDAQWFDAQGMAMVGSRIALVKLALAGLDYNYDAGKEPMVAAVQRAAAKLS
jgi:hypothetical protein